MAFRILPIFAFANAAASLHGVSLDYLLHPVPPGIMLGLFAGKDTGVNLMIDARIGIIAGSLLSAVAGYFLLRGVLPSGSQD